MKLDVETHNDVTVMRVAGELNADAASKMNPAIDEAFDQARRDFVIDLSEVTVIDSKGLELLTALQRRCEEELGMVRLCGLDETMRKIFELTRLDQSLTIVSSIEEAEASLVQT